MFLHELSHAQREAFLILARQVIDADHRLAIQEVERLDRLYSEAGFEPETAEAAVAIDDLQSVFMSERSRVVVILDLLLVGYADGTLHPAEAEAIRQIGARLGLDAGVWEHALDWARRLHQLVVEAEDMGTVAGAA
ncbi:MAG: TerB family tellurite resistance protein [Bacteroidota bacterium]